MRILQLSPKVPRLPPKMTLSAFVSLDHENCAFGQNLPSAMTKLNFALLY